MHTPNLWLNSVIVSVAWSSVEALKCIKVSELFMALLFNDQLQVNTACREHIHMTAAARVMMTQRCKQQGTDSKLLLLQLSENRYQYILSKCRSKVISAEQQVSMTASMCVSD